MWVLKTEKTADGTLLGALAKKHSVSFSGYPITHWRDGERVMVRVAGFIEGTQADIDQFVLAVRKEPFVKSISCKKNFAIALLNLHPAVGALYDPRIIFVKPAMYGRDGLEVLELASDEKEPLMHVVATYKEKFNCKVVSFTRRNIDSIGLVTVHPDLTDKQKQALQLAVKHGYYSFPRKITLEQLAKLMGVAFSTYQAHLAKAEANFIPEMVGKFL